MRQKLTLNFCPAGSLCHFTSCKEQEGKTKYNMRKFKKKSENKQRGNENKINQPFEQSNSKFKNIKLTKYKNSSNNYMRKLIKQSDLK